MALVSALIRGGPVLPNRNPNDDRLWTPITYYRTATGIQVTADLAFQVSCVFHGTRLISEGLGMLPLILYRRRSDDSRERARDHPLWSILHDSPCSWLDTQTFREILTGFTVLWNSAYAEIVSGPRGFVDELWPIHPERVTVRQLENHRLVYAILEPNGTTRTLAQDQMFHLRGFGLDSLAPRPLLALAREAFGLWLAQEKFNAVFFRQGARPSLWMKVPGELSTPAYERLKQQVSERTEGVDRMHRVLLAEHGSEFKEFGFSARDAQMTEARDNQAADIARWMNIPLHMFHLAKTPTYASAEQFAREYVDYTLRPPAGRWEKAIGRQLIVTERDNVYAEFLFDALLRGDTAQRYEAYLKATGGRPFMWPSEVRRLENLDPDEELDDVPAQGAAPADRTSSTPKQTRKPSPPPAESEPDDDEEEASTRAPRRFRLMVAQAAASLVRIEGERITKHAAQLASQPAAWSAWVDEFYRDEYAPLVAERLQLEPAVVADYVGRHRGQLLAEGLGALEVWRVTAAGELATLAQEGV